MFYNDLAVSRREARLKAASACRRCIRWSGSNTENRVTKRGGVHVLEDNTFVTKSMRGVCSEVKVPKRTLMQKACGGDLCAENECVVVRSCRQPSKAN